MGQARGDASGHGWWVREALVGMGQASRLRTLDLRGRWVWRKSEGQERGWWVSYKLTPVGEAQG